MVTPRMPALCFALIHSAACAGVMSPASTSATLPVSEPDTVISTLSAPGHLSHADGGQAKSPSTYPATTSAFAGIASQVTESYIVAGAVLAISLSCLNRDKKKSCQGSLE